MKTISMPHNLSANLTMYMSFPIEFTNTGNVKAITSKFMCREQLIGAFMVEIRSERKKIKKNLDKARIIVFNLPDVTDDNLKKVIKPLNVIEKEMGLPKTRIIHVVTNENQNDLMFEGSIKWYRSSHTMSLWLMILRVCLRNPDILYGETFKDILKKVKKFPVYCGTNGEDFELEDRGYIHDTIHVWIPLMKNINKIFSFRTSWKTRYTADKIYTSPNHEYTPAVQYDGIYSLVTNKSKHDNVDKFRKLVLNKRR